MCAAEQWILKWVVKKKKEDGKKSYKKIISFLYTFDYKLTHLKIECVPEHAVNYRLILL